MNYRVIALMSGSSCDGLDIGYIEYSEQAGEWNFNASVTACIPYTEAQKQRLQRAHTLSARDYLTLHADFGRYSAQSVRQFIAENDLHFKVDFIVSHGHTVFHDPKKGFSAQIGCGAHLAAQTHLPVINELRSMDIAYGGQGAPIIAIGEKMLFKDVPYFLNIGGISNISANLPDTYIAFDVCPANSMLNYFAAKKGYPMDAEGHLAEKGVIHHALLTRLDVLEYLRQPYPKSLDNQWWREHILPVLEKSAISAEDALATCNAFISRQVKRSLQMIREKEKSDATSRHLMITGGGAFNRHLITQIRQQLPNYTLCIPEPKIVKFKEIIVMGLIGVLRYRQQANVLAGVSGAAQNSSNGALWYAEKEH